MSHISDYIEYFRLLAKEHYRILDTDIDKHFFVMDYNELLSSTRSNIEYPALILIRHQGSFVDDDQDNRLNKLMGGFVILYHLKTQDDFDGEMTIFQNAFNIGSEIISRISKDHSKCDLLAQSAVPGFSVGNVEWEMFGPVFSNHFGIMFKFPITYHLDLTYDPDHWITIPEKG